MERIKQYVMESRLWPRTLEEALTQFLSSRDEEGVTELAQLTGHEIQYEKLIADIQWRFGSYLESDELLRRCGSAEMTTRDAAGFILERAMSLVREGKHQYYISESAAQAYQMSGSLTYLFHAVGMIGRAQMHVEQRQIQEAMMTLQTVGTFIQGAFGELSETERLNMGRVLETYCMNDTITPGLYVVALVCWNMKRYVECIELLAPWLEKGNRDPAAFTLLAQCYHNTGDGKREMAVYKNMLAAGVANSVSWNNVGVCHFDQKNYKEAIRCYKKSLALNPNYALAYNNMGESYYKLGEIDKAMVCYGISITLNPDYGEVHRLMGDALRDKGHEDKFLQCYKRAAFFNDALALSYLRERGLSCGNEQAYSPD